MNPPRLLLVDDEPNILKALQRLFFDEEYEVYCAGSGEEGLEVLAGNEVDLIIADYRMPGMNGIDFFRRARQARPEAVRIILSGYADVKALAEAINEGNIYKFIFKPWNDEDLKNTLRLALEQMRLLSENQQLARELQQKNRQLEDFNRQLEQKVEERTLELQFRNKVLSISQEILELVPIGIVGFGDKGDLVLMNLQASRYLPAAIGRRVEEALPSDLAQCCREAIARKAIIRRETAIGGERFMAVISRLKAEDSAAGWMLVLHPASLIGTREVPPPQP
ncbi:MAG: response regulator [Candidatus Zixiibacteriota bacterium]|nr:MAG: response regulator [candidate division Zixibacteria bacterium]